MAVDKILYASHDLKYPVVARPYTDDMVVKEKLFTKDEVVAMLTEIQLEIEELDLKDSIPDYTSGAEDTRDYITNMIEETIDKLKGV